MGRNDQYARAECAWMVVEEQGRERRSRSRSVGAARGCDGVNHNDVPLIRDKADVDDGNWHRIRGWGDTRQGGQGRIWAMQTRWSGQMAHFLQPVIMSTGK